MCFPGKAKWEGSADELMQSKKSAKLPRKGDRVRVKSPVVNPYFELNGVQARKR